jgi:hypothetical protein
MSNDNNYIADECAIPDEDVQLDLVQEHFIFLRAEGKTLRECVFILQKPLSTLGDWNVKFKPVIQTFRKEEAENRLGMQKSERLAKLNTIMDKLQTCLENNNFNLISTQSAFSLYTQLFAMQDHLLNP